MNALATVLHKTLVVQFYRQNAGLFFVVLMLAGSFLRAQEHIALAEAAVHTPFMLGLYQVLWLIYTVFATRFAVSVIRKTEVLYLLRLIPPSRRWLRLVVVQVSLLIPTLAYTAFVGWISWQQETVRSSWQLLAGTALMMILPLVWLDYTLRTPNRQSLLANFGANWHERFTTPYFLFYIRYLVNQQSVLLFLTKGSTCLLMLGILLIYPTDEYDIRLLALGALVMAVGHSTIGYQLYQFEHEQLAILRNLPVSYSQRLLNYALLFTLLLIPETVLFVRYRPVDVSLGNLASVWAFGHSLVLLQFTLLLPRHRSPDQLMPLVFGLLVLFFLAIMYQLPLWGLSLLNWGIASGVFSRFYSKSAWLTEQSG